MSTEYTDADAFLAGGTPSAKFDDIGTTVTGTIVEKPELAQQTDLDTGELKEWDDGGPMMQMIVTVQTELNDPEIPEDDGLRRFYVKAKLKAAVQVALRAAGSKKLEVGGILAVTYTGDGETKKRGHNPPKLYAVTYTPPATAFLATPDPVATGGAWTPPSDMPAWEAAALTAMTTDQRAALLALPADQRAQFLPKP